MSKCRLYIVFGLLILVWGGGWPVLKVGVQLITALWFSVLRFIIGYICMLLVAMATGHCRWPKRDELGPIVIIGLTQMTLFLGLLNIALGYVDATRAVMLVYTVPLWVAPVAVLVFGERMSKGLILGLVLGLSGVLLLFDPSTFEWSVYQTWLGNGLLLLCAICLAVAVIYLRQREIKTSILVLLPWQMLFAAVTSALFAWFMEPLPTILWDWQMVSVLLFTGILCTAFGYWALSLISQKLPSVISAFGLLGIPAMGVISSMLFLGERMEPTMLTGVVFIMIGLMIMAVTNKQ